MKKYEGLFIFDIDGNENAIKEALEKVSAEIVAQGGKVESTAKMGKRPFAHTPDKRVTSGYYVNVVFEAPAASIQLLRSRLMLNHTIYRVVFTNGVTAVLPQEDNSNNNTAPATAPAAPVAEAHAEQKQ